ncbi:MAG: DUF721 domain-containing protein [Proteobacteria bacterium]|nr:DUF721 domain-containing protein [Pseudomonadota bacterium]
MSRTDKSGRIDRFLPAELLQKMREHTTGQERWQHAWQHAAGDLAGRAEPISYSEGVLVLRVSSPGWASRLRYQLRPLIERLRSEADFSALTDIEVRVRPQADPDVEQAQQQIREERTRYERKATRMSDHTADVIQTAADAIDDPDLKQALQRLSKRNK